MDFTNRPVYHFVITAKKLGGFVLKTILKTIIDRLVALFFLLVFAPLLLAISFAIVISSKGGAIYTQTRVGRGGKNFQIYKFRSMFVGADRLGYQTADNDKRITPVGRFLRKTSLDELPQFFNVLKGDMSLVGPRPDTPMQKADYSESDWQLRHSVRPGITGLAQVSGRSGLTAEERLGYDLEYAKNNNLVLDIKILAKTVLVALARKGTN